MVARATARSRNEDGLGVRLDLPDDTDVAALAELVAAEQTCCAFFAFIITVDHRGLGLEVRAPAEASAALDGLLGSGNAGS